MFQLLLAVIYLAFISLGLPDSLLGAAWPTMYPEFDVPVSYAGIISMIIALGTIVSSLQSDRLTKKLGAGKVTALSVAMTAFALFGFSISHSFFVLIFWAIPYGLGAGSVDAALNNYVALHFESRHMSWLHCMWGVGASVGPYIMGYALNGGHGWNSGYRYIAILQIILTLILCLSLPLWKDRSKNEESVSSEKTLSLKEVLAIPGAKQIMLMFFCYCALEQTTGLWASSYLVLHKGVSAERAANFASMFFIGITIGRAISGFITMKLNDTQMIRLGSGIIIMGIAVLLLPFGETLSFARTHSDRSRLRTYLSLCHSFDTGAFRRKTFAGDHRCADGKRVCWHLPHAADLRSDRELYHRCTAAALPASFYPAHVHHARAVKPHCVRF